MSTILLTKRTKPPNPSGDDSRLWVGEDGVPRVVDAAGVVQTFGVSIPEGGDTGQFLAKKSATNYDAEWVDSPSAEKVATTTTNFNKKLSSEESNVQLLAERLDEYNSLEVFALGLEYRIGNSFRVTTAGDEGIWVVSTAFTSANWATDKVNCAKVATDTPISSVIALAIAL
jgi:hypothetical protein